jgi:hypothetical protein
LPALSGAARGQPTAFQTQEPSTVPKIKPTPPAQQQAYRAELPRKQRPLFDQLRELIAAPRTDLPWYHAVGTLLVQLRGGRSRAERGQQWLTKLAEALGPSPSQLQQALRFAALYPTEGSVRELQEMNVDWARLYIAFVVSDKVRRHELLREALEQGWTIERVRVESQQRETSKRRGMGGRKPRKPRNYGPETTLRDFERASGRWLAFHENAWSKVKVAEWRRLVRDWPAADRDRLRKLLRAAVGKLAKMAEGCEEARSTLADLLGRLGWKRKTEPRPAAFQYFNTQLLPASWPAPGSGGCSRRSSPRGHHPPARPRDRHPGHLPRRGRRPVPQDVPGAGVVAAGGQESFPPRLQTNPTS